MSSAIHTTTTTATATAPFAVSDQESPGARPLAVEFLRFGLASSKRFDRQPKGWSRGDRWELIPEPGNAADPNAIKVMREGRQIAYVARVDAQKIKQRMKDGWRLCGWCFFESSKGGEWGEGQAVARLEHPVMGWAGYNPMLPMKENLAGMEAEALAEATRSLDGEPREAGPPAPRL